MKIVAAQTADLPEEDVAKADVVLAAAGQVKNPAGLRDFARRQVARLDPQAAARKKERGRREAYVRAWQEDSGNMGLSAREMPSVDGVIAWQNIEQRALDLHAAGVEGTSGQLQVQAMLDFLLARAAPAGVRARTRTDMTTRRRTGTAAARVRARARTRAHEGAQAIRPRLHPV